jgi:hypothetical protein
MFLLMSRFSPAPAHGSARSRSVAAYAASSRSLLHRTYGSLHRPQGALAFVPLITE